jgi:hypothetical protein
VPSISTAAPARREKSLSESLHGAAKDAYQSAELLFNSRDFRGAIAEYQQAYDLSKDARLLYNMAIAQKELREYARMQASLVRYKVEVAASISPEDQAAVDSALAAIQNLVGRVAVNVNIAGAKITLDGESVGNSPLATPLVIDLGKHTLSAEAPGFEVGTKSIEIAGGTETSVALVLVPEVKTGQLVVAAEPSSTILIDGNVAAQERFDGKLPAGAHEVRVTAQGKVPYKAEIDLREKETRTLQVTLLNEGHGTLWPWIAGGVVLAAGAAVGGYFLFKPKDETIPVPTGPNNVGFVHFATWRMP